jgi:hypothetical protein
MHSSYKILDTNSGDRASSLMASTSHSAHDYVFTYM